MAITTETTALPDALEAIRAVALSTGLPYAGAVPPQLAWELFSAGEVVLVDVRTTE